MVGVNHVWCWAVTMSGPDCSMTRKLLPLTVRRYAIYVTLKC